MMYPATYIFSNNKLRNIYTKYYRLFLIIKKYIYQNFIQIKAINGKGSRIVLELSYKLIQFQ